MKLYAAPFACSLASHIALEASGLPFEVVIAKWGNKPVWTEIDRLSPLGAVPVLVLEGDEVLTQNIAILSHIAAKAPKAKLLAAEGTLERAHTYEWLSFAAADLHKAFSPLFDKGAPAEVKKAASERVEELMAIADARLKGRSFLVGNSLTIADCYLYVVACWPKFCGMTLEKHPNVAAFVARLAEHPAVKAAHAREAEEPVPVAQRK